MRLLRVLLAVVVTASLTLVGSMPANAEPLFVNYAANVQNIGWQPYVAEGATAGTTGQSLRMELFTVRGVMSTTQAHVQNIGWQAPLAAGSRVGVPGLRLEAVRVKSVVTGWGIECRAHVQNIGWRAWVPDGATCGTTGQSLRLEAVQLRLVRLVRR